ncbi:MAG: thiol-disulfide oxidoreductase DCC family protein [Eudoraea sp.]|nr:thiol-disulfide oxidoreductase DCC family protein [Eudoraea sp.]
MTGKEHSIILFDGVCNLCNSAVQFIIKHDKKDRYRFSAIQSEQGKKLTSERNIDTKKIDSIILIEPGKAYYIKAPAALQIGKSFGGGWRALSIFEWVPPVISNWIYDLVARNRYRWFGRKEQCMIPTEELKAKFLE